MFDRGATIQGGTYTIALEAQLGGYISAPAMTIRSCADGVFAYEGGIIDVESAIFEQNFVGINAETKGHVDAQFTSFGTGGNADTSYDVAVALGGTVDVQYAYSSYTSSKGTNDGSNIWAS